MADLSNTLWSETDGANNAAPPDGWPEGQMPSTVNDCARANMGALKRFWDRLNPVQTITPVSGVWTFVTSNPAYPTAYVNGEIYAFNTAAANAAGDQFQVNGLGPKPIYRRVGNSPVAVVANDWVPAWRVMLVYGSSLGSGAGGFLLLNPYVPAIRDDGSGNSIVTGNLSVSGSITAGGAMILQNNQYLDGYDTGAVLRNLIGYGSDNVVHVGDASTPLILRAAGAGTLQLNGGNLYFSGYYLYFANGTGAINAIGGPLVYADATYTIFKLGSGNGAWIWQDYSGTNRANIDSSGNLTLNSGSLNITTGNLNAVAISASSSVTCSAVQATGSGAGINFSDRSGSPNYGFSGNAGVVTLSNTAHGAMFQIDQTGNMSVIGALTVGAGMSVTGAMSVGGTLTTAAINASANITTSADVHTGNLFASGFIQFTANPSAVGGVDAGHTARTMIQIYSDNNLYVGDGALPLQLRGNGVTVQTNVQLNGVLTQSGDYIYLANGTGAINSTGGPFLYADANNMAFKLGSGNANWLFQDYSGTNRCAISAGGGISLNGLAFASGSTSYMVLYDPTATGALLLGGSGDRTNYYRNQTHRFQTTAGAADMAVLTATSLTQAGNYHYFANATGAVNTTGGPLVYADATNWVTKFGSGNGAWGLQNYAGTTVASISAAGVLNTTGNITASGNIGATGSGAALSFNDQATAAVWQWFASSNVARLNLIGVGDMLQMNTTGGCANTTGSWGAISDPRTKRDVRTYDAGLQAVRALRPIAYRYNGQFGTRDDPPEVTRYGIDARATQAVMPELVMTIDTETEPVLGIDNGPLIYALVNAVQQLAERLDRLERRLHA